MKYCLDRIEGNVAVCLQEDGAEEKAVTFSLSDYPELKEIGEGNLFEATLSADGDLTDILPLKKESEESRASAENRLAGLFARKKRKD